MEQNLMDQNVRAKRAAAKPSSVWKLAAVVALIAAFVLDWVGLQVFRDGMWQRAHPSPRVPQLGNIELAWTALALYLSMILFALSFAMASRGTPPRVVRALGWLFGAGLVAVALMVPGTYFWATRTTPDEDAVSQPGGDWSSDENAGDAY
ncbi:MAG: hypothetical protein KF708_12450 [Pirellulales bacterium]|nr:hypothetical protein [Pirellulales bacterium]